MFNRVYLNNTWLYLGGKEQSLYNSLTAGAEGYGTFLHKYNVGLGTESKPDLNNNPNGRPDPFDIKGYIEKYKHITPDLEERWEFSLQLAKVMVSICGNQTMTVEKKRNKFKQLAPSPFPEKINGEKVDIDRIVEYATDGHNGRFIHKTEWVHYFGYTPGDKDLNEQNWNVG